MEKSAKSTKLIQIDKAQSNMLIIVGVAAVISGFSLVSAKALLVQAGYHRREINAKHDVVKQLNASVAAANTLFSQYQVFNDGNPNVIGGKKSTDANVAPPNGDNSRIVLNALPTKYDFPALISSLSKILNDNAVGSPSIGGSDQSGAVKSDSSATPKPVSIDLSVSGSTTYAGSQTLVKDFERSIRPFDIKSFQLHGNSSLVSISMNLTTYFQPAKISITATKEVK